MNYYKQYMDRQTLSPEFLEKLERRGRRPRGRWRRWGALAACCLLLAGLGLHMSRPAQTTPVELPQTAEPAPEKGKQLTMPQLAFQDNTAKRVLEDTAPVASPPAPALEPTLAPEANRGEQDRAVVAEQFGGEIPEILGWEEFEVLSRAGDPGADYLYVSGQAQDFTFDLAVQEGKIPDLAPEGGEITEFCGVEIAGVKQTEDLYEVSFLTPEEVGVYYSVKGEDGPEWTAALVWALLAPKGEN